MAIVAVAKGKPEDAARISGAVERLKEPLGQVATPVEILRLDDPAQSARELLGSETFGRLLDEGRGLSMEATIGIVSGL